MMVEHSTNFLIMEKYLKTITTDNGSEFAEHERTAHRLALDIYFADAYASWQKGAIENTNKLRQYIPKRTDISTVTDKRIKMIQVKNQQKTKEKIELLNTKAGVLQILFVILHLLVDSLI